ncbi:hypothetical protein D3C81_1630160 [compost metagenome]
MQDIPAETELFQYAGAKVLDQDVRFAQEFFQDRQALRMFQVQRQGLFVACLNEPPQRGAFIQLAPLAQRIAAVRGFDLDHVRTEFSANARRKGAGNQSAQFDDFQT